MNNKSLFQKPITWVALLLIAIVGGIYAYNNFDKAISLVNVEIEMDRKTALNKAAGLAQEFNLGPENYKQAAAFNNDSEFQNFVELEAGGLDTFQQVIALAYYSPYQWVVRHFKSQETKEVEFRFKPDGSIYGFVEKIPESRESPSFSVNDAKEMAEKEAMENWQVDLQSFKLIEQWNEKQTNGRTDHTFVYERNEKISNDSGFRLKLVVSGNKLSAVDYHTKIPEDFKRRYAEMRSDNELIATIASAVMVVLYLLLGVIVGVFILLRSRRLIWKPAMLWGLGIAFASVFLVSINHLPFAWFSYDTASSESNFLTRQLLTGLLSALGMGGLLALTFMAAEGLGRMAFPKHIQWWRIILRKNAGSLPVLGQVTGGYLFAVIIVAFDVLFYVTTTNHLGWWSPAGTLSDPNILATYLPWFDSIAISLQAGFWEEALFRAIPIAGITILTKGKKSRNLWIIAVLLIQTLIFGAGHANYPQQPSYARIIEMIIPFAIMGIIYIYYGILPAVVAHFAVDVFWFSLPLWVSSSDGIWGDRIFVLLFLFIPLFVVLFARAKNRKWLKISSSEINQGWIVPEKPEKEKKQEAETIQESSSSVKIYYKLLIPLALVGLIIWIMASDFKNDVDGITLSKKEAVAIAKQELTNHYNLDFEQWTILSKVEDRINTKDIFVWRTAGKEAYSSLVGHFLPPPYWEIRLVKTEGNAEDRAEEFMVRINDNKKVRGIKHILPEKAPGDSLSREAVQVRVDSVLLSKYGIQRHRLKEVSVSPEKLENRTDWEFIYADTLAYTLKEGEGRYKVNIAGSEVTSTNPFVHIPEEWERKYKEDQNKKSVIETVSMVLMLGVILLGIIIGIIRWTRRKFNLKAFVITAGLFLLFTLVSRINGWDDALAGYTTQIPMNTFVITLIVGLVMAGIFMPAAMGILVGASNNWLPVQKKNNGKWYYAVLLGIILAALLVLPNLFIEQSKPFWPDLGYLNTAIPVLDKALGGLTGLVVFPTFAMVLFMGIHHYTKAFTTKKWLGILFSFLAGLALASGTFSSYQSWIIETVLFTLVILVVYLLFIRHHFEWLPLAFGTIPVLSSIKAIIRLGTTEAIIGGVISISISILFLVWWYRLLLAQQPTPVNHEKKSEASRNQ